MSRLFRAEVTQPAHHPPMPPGDFEVGLQCVVGDEEDDKEEAVVCTIFVLFRLLCSPVDMPEVGEE